MRIQFALVACALTVTACASEQANTSHIRVEYVKSPQVVVITDQMLGMDQYRSDKHIERARLDIQQEHFALAATIWGEARGETYDGMRAVGYVVANRIKYNFRTDGTVEGTVKWPKQFSCWNENDPNYNKLTPQYLNNELQGNEAYQWETAKIIAMEIMENGTVNDNTKSSIFYHAHYVSPNWASNDNKSVVIGQHIFYKKAV